MSLTNLRRTSSKTNWQLESTKNTCSSCNAVFSTKLKKHHCRECGKIFCWVCSSYQAAVRGYTTLQRVCRDCKISKDCDENTVSSSSMMLQMLLRDMSDFVFKAALPEYGRRGYPFKTYAQVTDSNNQAYIFCCFQPVEDIMTLYKSENRRRQFRSLMTNTITHPYISVPEFSEFRSDKVVSFRSYNPKGTLKDMLYASSNLTPNKKTKVDPSIRYTQKYYDFRGKPLSVDKIAKYGRQTLESLYYLFLHYFPFPHLHPGNIFIGDNDVTLLTDLESSLLGLEPYYIKEIQSFLVQGIKIQPEVVSFGHVLFEMAMGHPKQDSELQDYKGKCDNEVFSILESIFEPADKENPPTIRSLLKHKFFSSVQLYITVHEITLKEKWSDDDTNYLKQIRSFIKRILMPSLRQTKSSSSLVRRSSERSSPSESRRPSKQPSKTNIRTSQPSKTSTTTTTTTTTSAPPPPPPPKSNSTPVLSGSKPPAPPPPPPSNVPERPSGHMSLMEAIRNANKASLKKVNKD